MKGGDCMPRPKSIHNFFLWKAKEWPSNSLEPTAAVLSGADYPNIYHLQLIKTKKEEYPC